MTPNPIPESMPSVGISGKEHTTESHQLERRVSWKSAAIISMGGSILVAVSLAAMAADLGSASIFVWTLTALIGVANCLMICEMAGMFPHKSGGGAVYAHEAFKTKSPFPGAIAAWGYWLGWIPVIPVNLVLIAGYLKGTLMPNASVPIVAVVLALALYGANYFGLKPGVWMSVAMAVFAMGPLLVIALSPIYRAHLFSWANILPFVPLKGSWTSGASWLLMIKWAFIAAWSSYAFESASTVVAELKDPHRDAPKAMVAASIVGMFAYGIVPLVMLGIVGVETLSKDPSIAFLPAAAAIFGKTGASVVVIMLVAALLLGAQTAIIGSSRTVYEMSKDGTMIKQFGHLNPFGVPDRGMVWDCLITLLLLVVFKDNVINMVGASTVGYMMVWMILPIAYILLRRDPSHANRPFKLPAIFIPLAAVFAVFNAILLFVGGFQWGGFTPTGPFVLGFLIMFTFVPFYLIRRAQNRSKVVAPMFSSSPVLDMDDDLAEAI